MMRQINLYIIQIFTTPLKVGENYYHPMTEYLSARGTVANVKVETPGAMDFK